MKSVMVLSLAALSLVTAGPNSRMEWPPKPVASPHGMGNPGALRAAYQQWKTKKTRASSDNSFVLSLAWSKGLSAEHTLAHGEVTLNLVAGSVSLTVQDLEQNEPLEVWFVENRPGPGQSVIIESGDRVVKVGRLEPQAGRATLQTQIPAELLGNFDLDLVVVARAGRGARAGGLLYGTPDLFQRLYGQELRSARGAKSARLSGVLLALAAAPLAAIPEAPGDGASVTYDLDTLVSDGENLFFNATFGGNGRTCGSCHPAQNNLTVDPPFIATLPASDPLFIAENRPNHPFPDLVFELNGGRRFENPVLMRQHGLIVENQDGFGDLANRFNMRGVPHVFAQTLSIVRQPGSLNPPADRTGWSGDGAPNNGALRDFATGAVTQHFTKRLNRVPGVDFVLPTSAELTAMEAFQRSLGRQTELDLPTLALRDAEVTAGKELFQDDTAARCNRCHFNAGANGNPVTFGANPGNRNFNTGVEFFQVDHPDGTGQLRPVDGGFGTNPQGTFTSLVANSGEPTRPDGGFGDGRFNTPSLVEFADTLPGFHNNITSISAGLGSTPDLPNTVEGAITFYTRTEFTRAGNAPLSLNATQIARLGKFLRAINALENRRSASDFAARARALLSTPGFDDQAVNRLISLAIADCNDGEEVLDAIGLHHQAAQNFHQAQQKLEGATSGPTDKRIEKIDEAQEKLNDVRAEIEIVP